jgi:small subunit ribosomal protein S15
MPAKELEMLIVRMVKEGHNAAKIGLMLRDSYGIPDARPLLGKRISALLAEKNLVPEIPDDVLSLMKKAVLVRKHLAVNPKDEPAHRGLQLTEAKIKRLAKYYKSIGRLAVSWKYDPEKAATLVH